MGDVSPKPPNYMGWHEKGWGEKGWGMCVGAGGDGCAGIQEKKKRVGGCSMPGSNRRLAAHKTTTLPTELMELFDILLYNVIF